MVLLAPFVAIAWLFIYPHPDSQPDLQNAADRRGSGSVRELRSFRRQVSGRPSGTPLFVFLTVPRHTRLTSRCGEPPEGLRKAWCSPFFLPFILPVTVVYGSG
jgi:hypothetical protein